MISREHVLQAWGLSPNEAKIYLASLALGSATANAIARRAGLLRTTAYEILNALAGKGLASSAIRSGVKYFEAAPPERLLAILDERKKEVASILHDLNELRRSVQKKPDITLYEGREGLKTILDAVLAARPREILQLNSAAIFQTLHYYFPQWIRKRSDLKVRTRVLQEDVPAIRKLHEKDALESRELRFLPPGFPVAASCIIYGDSCVFLAMKADLVGLLIEQEEIARTQRALFESLWSAAPS